jgi:xanthine dehydrogenase accessory factor
MNETVHDPLAQLGAWQAAGQKAALATVVATWGSSPRPVGSHMAVHENGTFVGSVSGGCIEGAVVDTAQEVIRSGQHKLLEFGVSNEAAWEVGLACGGRIQVLVEPLESKAGTLGKIADLRARKTQFATVTDLTSGAQGLVKHGKINGGLALVPNQMADVAGRISADKSGVSGHLFVRVYSPPARMVIVGAVHIAQALAPMAVLAGFDVTVIDPREAFVRSGRFDNVIAILEWPDDGMRQVAPDARTAVVTLTHDPKLDDPALAAALRSPAFYIGALGSRKTHAQRTARLAAAGFAADQIARIHGPVGLDISALTPPEIAVSIMAQVVEKLRAEAA